MKKRITLLILAFTINVSAQIKNEYYKNGQIKAVGKYDGYDKVGLWKEYYENGKLSAIGEMKGYSRFGDWKTYHSNGKLSGNGIYDEKGNPIPGTWKTYNENGESDGCNCPEPTKYQFMGVCNAIYARETPSEQIKYQSYGYQEYLFKMACANPNIDSFEILKEKMNKMWLRNRESFRCYNYPTMISSEKNVMKFSLESGFTTMLTEGIKRWNLDMNFIDTDDKKTILDFVQDQEKFIRNSPPVDSDKADEYQRIYQLLKTNGAKHSYELNN